jgi:hypothetical protein
MVLNEDLEVTWLFKPNEKSYCLNDTFLGAMHRLFVLFLQYAQVVLPCWCVIGFHVVRSILLLYDDEKKRETQAYRRTRQNT